MMVVLVLVFKETSLLFSIVAVSIYIPTNNVTEFPFLHILSSIYCLVFLMMAILTMVFPIVKYGYESWTIKKAECQRTDAFKL